MGKNGTEGRKSSNQEADSPVDVNCQPAFPPPFAFFSTNSSQLESNYEQDKKGSPEAHVVAWEI